MYSFFKTIIEPLLETLQPRTVVEVGSEEGAGTKPLLEYCAAHGAHLHVIEPAPKYDLESWQEQHASVATFHKRLSLNALPLIASPELVLIDGDHNWYTVYHELKILKQTSAEARFGFPVVALHDVAWPYGRRDLYYEPENIPPAFRKPYKQLGMQPGEPELVENGLNAHLNNAIYENGPQNGVLTAVEDFQREAGIPLELIVLPGLNGLGILVPMAALDALPELRRFFDDLRLTERVFQHVTNVEGERLKTALERGRFSAAAKERLGKLNELREHSASLEVQRAELQSELDQRKAEVSDLQSTVAEHEGLLRDQALAAATLREELGQGRARISELEANVAEIEGQLRDHTQVVEELRGQLSQREQALSALKAKLAEHEGKQREHAQVVKDLRGQLQEREGELRDQAQGRERLRDELSERNAAVAQLETRLQKSEGQLREHEQVVEELRAQLSQREQALSELQVKIAQLEGQQQKQELHLAEQARLLKEKSSAVEKTARQLADSEATRRGLDFRVELLEQEVGAVRSEENAARSRLEERERLLDKQSQRVLELEGRSAELENQLLDLGEQAELQSGHNRTLNEIIETLEHHLRGLENSKRWRWGKALGDFRFRLALKRLPLLDVDYMREALTRFRAHQAQAENASPHGQNAAPGRATGRDPQPEAERPTNSVDIVVCVHNALEDTRRCLESVVAATPQPYRLIIVNDGSDPPTTNFLREFAGRHESFCVYLQSGQARGYTVAANDGLRASRADYVILLNSDTVVPRTLPSAVVQSTWVEKLLECGNSDPKIGMVGPLSNAASWQSVPEPFGPDGGWNVNQLPDGFGVDEMADLVQSVSQRRFPRVPFVNGFCLVVKRAVIEKIGLLDAQNFPRGYGEENDYCLRAEQAGFSMAIADHAYVFHAKSRSYGSEQRDTLSKAGSEALAAKYPPGTMRIRVEKIKHEGSLHTIRLAVADKLTAIEAQREAARTRMPRVLFILPAGGAGGGVHSVVQEATGMRELGAQAQVATLRKYENNYRHNYPAHHEAGLFLFYRDADELAAHATDFDVAVATIYHSISELKAIADQNPYLMPAYYVQDYEPLFSEEGSAEWQRAYDSYSLIPAARAFAKTDWLCQTVQERHGIEVAKVSPSLDHGVYHPPLQPRTRNGAVMLTAMIRPKTPRRAPLRTLQVLQKLKAEFGADVSVEIFGLDSLDVQYLGKALDFEHVNHGVLTREQVAELLRRADVFLDLSDYQAFGRTGLEAMACGCATVLPQRGGVHEYAHDEVNTLLVDTEDEPATLRRLSALVRDPALLQRLQEEGPRTASAYSIRRAAESELEVLGQAWRKGPLTLSLLGGDASVRRVAVLVARRSDGVPTGAAFVRLIQPLAYLCREHPLRVEFVRRQELLRTEAHVIIAHRDVLPGPAYANSLLEHCRARGVLLSYDLDDDLLSAPLELRPQPIRIEAMRILAANADQVTAASPLLIDKLEGLRPQGSALLPNVLDEHLWLNPINGKWTFPPSAISDDSCVRFVYIGAKDHYQDLQLVAEAYSRLKSTYGDRVSLEVVGTIPNNAESIGVNLTPPIDPPRFVDYADFVKWVRQQNQWAVGLIPLRETPFNRHKSYLKYLDYAALGLAVVATRTDPYTEIIEEEGNGLLVENDSESWYRAMVRLVEDAELRQRMAKAAFADLTEHHLLQHHARRWWELMLDAPASARTETDHDSRSPGGPMNLLGHGRTGSALEIVDASHEEDPNWQRLLAREFDFLDIGTASEGSFTFAKQHLGGTEGIGVELSLPKVEAARKAGVPCIHGDITVLPLPADIVRMVTTVHVLEFLPDEEAIRAALATAMRAARDLVFVRGPYFDADAELAEVGLKLYWSDWRGHLGHPGYEQIAKVAMELGATAIHFAGMRRITRSTHETIHPLASPSNQHRYDPAVHPPKPEVSFDFPVYREWCGIIAVRPLSYWDDVLLQFSEDEPLLRYGKGRRFTA